MRQFKIGDRVLVRFLRHDGTEHRDRGTITRLWGKKPHAASVDEDNGGPIRVPLGELTYLGSFILGPRSRKGGELHRTDMNLRTLLDKETDPPPPWKVRGAS